MIKLRIKLPDEKGFEFEYPLSEDELIVVQGNSTNPPIINKNLYEWYKDVDGLDTYFDLASALTGRQKNEYAELFFLIIASADSKGKVLCTQQYKNKEEFLERFNKYLKKWRLPKTANKLPSDICLNVLAAVHYSRSGKNFLEVTEELIPYIVPITNEIDEGHNEGLVEEVKPAEGDEESHPVENK